MWMEHIHAIEVTQLTHSLSIPTPKLHAITMANKKYVKSDYKTARRQFEARSS